MALHYKFVELSIVTDESIEEAVNAWVARGWTLDGIRFVTNDASRRPQMAFISFTREIAAPLTLDHDAPEPTETVEQTAPRPKGPRLVKQDPED